MARKIRMNRNQLRRMINESLEKAYVFDGEQLYDLDEGEYQGELPGSVDSEDSHFWVSNGTTYVDAPFGDGHRNVVLKQVGKSWVPVAILLDLDDFDYSQTNMLEIPYVAWEKIPGVTMIPASKFNLRPEDVSAVKQHARSALVG